MANKNSKAKSSTVNQGGISIGGNATIKDSTLVGRDKVEKNVTNQTKIVNLSISFAPLYESIKDRPNTTPEVKTEIENSTREIESEIKKKTGINYSFITERLTNIQKIAPDIAQVILATIQNPMLGLGTVAEKILTRMKNQTAE